MSLDRGCVRLMDHHGGPQLPVQGLRRSGVVQMAMGEQDRAHPRDLAAEKGERVQDRRGVCRQPGVDEDGRAIVGLSTT